MAMLAGPRRKQKVINLRAKNNTWSNDATKFGQRMLERMGWESGKGLGAREQGTVEHVIARYKNDEAGLGYQERSDQWTQHEDQFNALLADLSNGGSVGGGGGGRDGEAEQEAAHGGVSLEVKSKRSRARVHYHKFTRGKDLSRYSRKELANIFGKKSLNLPPPAQHRDGASRQAAAAPSEPADAQTVFTEGGSMLEYFQRKMKSLGASVERADRDPQPDCGFRGFAGTELPESSEYSCCERPVGEDRELHITGVNNVERKKKKKKKNADRRGASVDHASEDKSEKTKRKTEAKVAEEVEAERVEMITESQENETKLLKKKKKKCKADALAEQNRTEESGAARTVSTGPTNVTSTKKKKSKRKVVVIAEEAAEALETERPPEKKKKNKNK